MARDIFMADDNENTYNRRRMEEDDLDRKLREMRESTSSEEVDIFGNFESIFESNHEIPEKPTAKPYDQKDVPASRSSEIPLTAYNKNIDNLKRSFKENVEIINQCNAKIMY